MRIWMCLLCVLTIATNVSAASKTETWTSDLRVWAVPTGLPASEDPQYWFDSTDGALSRSRALDVMEQTMGRCHGPEDAVTKEKLLQACGFATPTIPGDADYVLIHVLRWRTATQPSPSLEIDKQHWYVVRNPRDLDDESFTGSRLYGTRRIYLLYVHLNRPAGTDYTPTYTVTAKKKTAAWLNQLTGLGQLFGISPLAPAGAGPGTKEIAVWNVRKFDIDYVPSDVTIAGHIQQASAPAKPIAIAPKVFDNEGKYRVDFTVGVPIRKFTGLQYATADGLLKPVKVDKSAIFALFNYHFQPVDTKQQIVSWVPHVIAGVAIQDRPLKKVLIGAGVGPILAQFYAGVLLNTYAIPEGGKCGATTPDPAVKTESKTCAEFAFGLNLSVGSVIEALKKKPEAAKPADTKAK